MNEVYKIFNSKLAKSIEDFSPKKYLTATFLNPYSMYQMKNELSVLKFFSVIGSDGILPIIIQRICGKKLTRRFSFDMSSVAQYVFDQSILLNKSIYFIGSTQKAVEQFVSNVKINFPLISIVGFSNGYVGNDFKKSINFIMDLDPDIVIIGMGTPLQEKFAIAIRQSGYYGSLYTCGGFIHQASEKFFYFNGWIDYFHLRSLYRMIKEPYVLNRVFLYYPRFVVTYFKYILFYINK